MDLSANFDAAHQRINAACERCGRDPETVSLLAVSKGHSADAVKDAVGLGQVFFGENRIQEAKVKIPLCPGRARWHMIGHLQTNKCRDAVFCFEMIESVDSLHLAQAIDKCAERAAKTIRILFEANIAGESAKHGYTPDRLLEELDALMALPRIEIHGLMTMAPWTPDKDRVRSCFRGLRELRDRCEDRMGVPLPQLSMGMSGDFEVAIEEGSTQVRLGTALFGERKGAVKRVQAES